MAGGVRQGGGNDARSRDELQDSAKKPDAAKSQQTIADLLSFVPGVVARHFVGDPAPPEKPRADRFGAAVLFADISGFTALAETLARRGPAGVDELTRLLNSHFGRLIDTIDAHGGDVIKFAGDALFALWPSQDEDLSTVTAVAARCALAAQSLFQNAETSEDLKLSIRIGIGAGPVTVLTVGGLNGRWGMVATGDALTQVSSPVNQAQPGQVVVSPEAWKWISGQAEGQRLEEGAMLLSSAGAAAPVRRPPPILLSLESAPALRAFIPPAVVSCLEQGRTDWLGELRRVTVLFIRFPGLTPATPLERAQSVMVAVQEILNRYEASMNKLSVDDKGVALLAALGLPPLGHEDDPQRGAQAALDIQERLRELNVRYAIGITTGRAFCGVVGNSKRCEYTMIGDVVNLASRLMQVAADDILCDQATYEAARGVPFEALPPVSVKGKASPLAVFRPVASGLRSPSSTVRMEGLMVGRESERTLLQSRLRALAATGMGGIVLVEGEAGIGKSRLIDDLLGQARALNIDVVTGQGHSVERSTPYFAWREVFEELCKIQSGDEREARREKAICRIGAEWADRASLVNPVLVTDFPETEATAGLTDQARSSQRHELLLRLLETQPEPSTPRALILEDGHWMDSASWTLAWLASQRVPSLLLVVTTRPMRDLAPDEFRALATTPGVDFLRLEALSADETIGMICSRLGVSGLPEQVEAMILDKAEGNPLFSQELAYALRDSGLILIANGECRMAPDVGDLSGLDIPGTVQAAITSRVDRLPLSQQLVLKVASVIGRVFQLQTLRRIYPIEAERGHLSEMMLGLTERDILCLDTPNQEAIYTFRHSVLQNVAYSLMLFSQRRQLHRTVAELLENAYACDLSCHYPLLAHHWGKVIEYGDRDSGLVSKVVDYLQKAGEHAMRSYANREAVTFLKEASRLLQFLPEGSDRDRKELMLQCSIGAPLIATKGFAAPETEKAFGRAWELCKQLGRAPEQFQVIAGLWNFYAVAAKFQKAQELAAELHSLAEATHDPALLLPAERALGETAVWLGRPFTAKEHLEKAVALYQPQYHEREAFSTAQNSAVVSLGFLSWSLWLLGYADQGLRRGREELSMARNLSHPFSVAMALLHVCILFQFRREPEASLDPLESVEALSREEGFQLWSAASSILRGWVLCEQGQEQAGIEQMQSSIEAWRATGAEVCFPYYLSLLAGAYGKAGRPEDGLVLIEEALSMSEATGEAWWIAELIRLKGFLTLLSPGDNRVAAETCFREAIEVARRQRAKLLELRAAVSLSRLLAGQGRSDEARRLLAAVYGWFEEGLETPDLVEARTLLEEIRSGRSIPNPAVIETASLSAKIS